MSHTHACTYLCFLDIPKTSKTSNFWLLVFHLGSSILVCYRRLASNFLSPNILLKRIMNRKRSIEEINWACYCFIPKIIWQTFLFKKCSCHIHYCLIFPFSHSILLWSIYGCYLHDNALWFAEICKFSRVVFSSSIWPECFDIFSTLFFSFCLNYLNFAKVSDLCPIK